MKVTRRPQSLFGTREFPSEYYGRLHVMQYSGGIGSWAGARILADTFGSESLHLLFADTQTEDEDLYRFLHESAGNLGSELTVVEDGRSVWDVFNDKRFIGNSRIDPCSEILKRNLLRSHIEKTFDSEKTVIWFGIDLTEIHRLDKIKPRWESWVVDAPLCYPPYIGRESILEGLQKTGIKVPHLYKLGFPHNNCGGFCVKAGKGQFKLLYKQLPDRYIWHMNQEKRLREKLDKDVSILNDTSKKWIAHRYGYAEDEVEIVYDVGNTGAKKKVGHRVIATGEELPAKMPLTLSMLKERMDAEIDDVDPLDIGGCGCALD